MGLGNIVNQFHDQYGLADTSASEKANFTSLGIGGEQIDNLDSSDKNFLLDRHLFEGWSLSVDGGPLVGLQGTTFINGIT